MNRSYAVIGCGGVGGYYGGCLQRAGYDVHFLLHSDYDYVSEHGLIVESKNGDFSLPEVNVYNDPRAMPQCDVVVVALKATSNGVLSGILPHIVKGNTVVLLLQNGLGGEDEIARIVDPNKILSGLCFLCSTKIGPGRIKHYDYGYIVFGEYCEHRMPKAATERIESIAKDFALAGIDVTLTDDLETVRWKKLVWNVPFNGLCVLNDGTTADILFSTEIRSLARKLMEEILEASAACARVIDDSFIDEMFDKTENMKPYYPSMKLDYDAGRPMEIEAIYGEALRRGKAKGVAMSETEKIYNQLKNMVKD